MAGPANSPAPLRDAARFWEPRRLWYNVALTAQAAAWVVLSWPRFRPAFTLASLGKVLVLALLANVCYSAAYLADIALVQSTGGTTRSGLRWALWLVGTLLALLFECYWIADEIYPYVGTG